MSIHSIHGDEPISRYLPPPIALRSFEAAARHLSFTRAASELNVTQAAISHQVKVLEEHLRAPLFLRLTRKLLLTDEGQNLYAVVSDAFDRIGDTADNIRNGTGNETLTVSLTPFFAARWLTHRLSRFWADYPQIDLRLHHSREPVAFNQMEVDLALSWRRADRSDRDATLLLRSSVVAVCSPRIISEQRPLSSPADLAGHTLLHDGDYELWNQWLKDVGVTGISASHGSTMDDSNVVLQAAIDGQGVALSSGTLLREELYTGRLVMPFGNLVSTDLNYYIIYPKGALEREKIRVFHDWLLAEAESSN